MCTGAEECTAEAACVAGRCQSSTPKARPAIDTARRLVVRPIDVAYLRRGDSPSEGALPPVFVLGREPSALLLRFAVTLPALSIVTEAYVILRRSQEVDADPAPILLHAARIAEPWDSRRARWAFMPKIHDLPLPTSVVRPDGPLLVRLDVRELVRHWPKHDPQDQGIAIVAENQTSTGMIFAMNGFRSRDLEEQSVFSRSSVGLAEALPELEIYLK